MALQVEQPSLQVRIERFERLTSPALADAQRGMRVVRPGIRSLVPGRVVAGPVFTVRAYPGSLMSVIKGVVEAPADAVLVVDADGDLTAGAIWGELIAIEARQRGLRGIVIDGAARDRSGLARCGFPTFASGTNPRLGANTQVGQINVPICCGGVPVEPGDWIFGDDDGVVVIPAVLLDTTLEAAEAIEVRDREIAERIADGERLIDLLGLHRFIYGDQFSLSVLSRRDE